MKNAILALFFLLVPLSQAVQQGWKPSGVFTDTETDMNFSDFAQVSTPSAPASARFRLYFKSDGNLYSENSSAAETLISGGGPTSIVNKYFYIDGSRTDSYTANGSFSFPFKTIGAAVTQVITNADNSTHPYTFLVAPFSYTETITLNNAALTNLTFESLAGPGTAIQNVVIQGITSTSNNTQLQNLVFNGITVNGPVNLTGDITNTNFCFTQCLFAATQFNNTSSTITLNNVNNVNFYNVQLQGTGSVATFTNVAFAYVANTEGFQSSNTLHLVDNPGGNIPSQYSGNYILFSETKEAGTITIDAGSEMDAVQVFFGSTSSITNNGTIHSFASSFNGSLAMNSGSTNRFRGDVFLNAPTGVGTITNQGELHEARLVVGASAQTATNAILIMKDGHEKSTRTTAPTAAPTANAGTGATCTVSNASDIAGSISLTTGTGVLAAGAECIVTFNSAYNVAPICVISPTNSNSGGAGNYITTSLTTLTINDSLALSLSTNYTFNYYCIETQ